MEEASCPLFLHEGESVGCSTLSSLQPTTPAFVDHGCREDTSHGGRRACQHMNRQRMEGLGMAGELKHGGER
jgi:hypothetical protein